MNQSKLDWHEKNIKQYSLEWEINFKQSHCKLTSVFVVFWRMRKWLTYLPSLVSCICCLWINELMIFFNQIYFNSVHLKDTWCNSLLYRLVLYEWFYPCILILNFLNASLLGFCHAQGWMLQQKMVPKPF